MKRARHKGAAQAHNLAKSTDPKVCLWGWVCRCLTLAEPFTSAVTLPWSAVDAGSLQTSCPPRRTSLSYLLPAPSFVFGFFSFWHSSHLHWWKVLLTHINGREKNGHLLWFFKLVLKKMVLWFPWVSVNIVLCIGRSVMKLILAWYLWLVSSGPCLLRGKTWGLLCLCNTVKLQSRYSGWAFLLPCLRRTKPIVANTGWSHVREKEGVSVWV